MMARRLTLGVSNIFVIPSEARNLSEGLIRAKKTTERFLASLGMTKWMGIAIKLN